MTNPRMIGDRYMFGDLIGQGGMGTVYRGRDKQTGRLVAIKSLRSDLVASDASMVERFEREGEALRRLNHPNIVQMLATVEEQGNHYLVLEYVEGGSLADLLRKEGALAVERSVQIALDLADALTRAHRLKIIHRDLKPANVLLSTDGTPRLTDFGVAHMGDRSRLTQSGSLVGTYAYLSPEACHGEVLDERADIWSFGVLLFEMLAGRKPFAGDQPGSVLTAILNKPTPSLLAIRPDVPPRLVRLIEQMLEKDRANRVASVRVVGAELEAVMRGEPLPTTPAPGGTVVLPERDAARFTTPLPSGTDTEGVETAPLPRTGAVSAPSISNTPPRSRWLFTGGVFVVVALAGLLAFALLRPPLGAVPAPPQATDVGTAPLQGTGAGTAPPQATDVGIAPPQGTGAATAPLQPVGAVAAPTPAPVLVAAVGDNELMVLVGRLEAINTSRADISRFVIDTLRQGLEVEVPFSRIKVREYPAVLSSASAAQVAAAANKASVVVWGNYDDTIAELNIEIGDTSAFEQIAFERSVLEQTANVRVRLDDPRNQSAARPVLVALNVLHNADGNTYENLRMIAATQQLQAENAEVQGNSVAARLNRFFDTYFSDSAKAQAEIDGAISLAPNGLLYTYRGSTNLRLGLAAEALRDASSAEQLGPPNWSSPLYLRGSSALIQGKLTPELISDGIATYNQIIDARPTDWFPYAYRGFLYYVGGEFEQGRADLERSISLQPDTNYPYLFASTLALRQGRVADGTALIRDSLTRYPDPRYGERILRAFFGDNVQNVLSPLYASYGSLLVGQYAQAAELADQALAIEDRLADIYFLRGFAQCNLKQYAEAEQSYSQGLAVAPDFALLHLLRAEVRQKQEGKGLLVLEDFAAIQESVQAEALAPYVAGAQNGSLSCENILRQ